MDATQTNKDNMFDATYEVLQNNLSIWTGNPIMVTAVTKLETYINGISATATAQGVVTTGVADSKQAVRETLIESILANASAGLAYASNNNNLTLKAKCKIAESSLTHCKETDLVSIAQNLHDALLPVAASLIGYCASTTTPADLQTKTSSFSSIIGTPRSARVSNITATESLEDQFVDTMDYLEDTLDPLMVQYKTSNPNFYSDYSKARKILNHGHRTTVILSGLIYHGSNVPLEFAKVTIVGNKHHKKITTANGHYKFTRLAAGTYIIQVEAIGYVTQTKSITVANPQTINTNFTMTAGTSSPTGGGGTTTGTMPPATA